MSANDSKGKTATKAVDPPEAVDHPDPDSHDAATERTPAAGDAATR